MTSFALYKTLFTFELLVAELFSLYNNAECRSLDRMIRAGGDVTLKTTSRPEDSNLNDIKSATAVKAMKESVKHLLYTTLNSNAMNNVGPGTIIYTTMSPWQVTLISVSSVIYVICAGLVIWTGIRWCLYYKKPEMFKEKKTK